MNRSAARDPPLAFFTYASRARGDWPRTRPNELLALVRAAAERNREREVSGLLVFHRGRFRQWLEGPESAITGLRRTILDDPRHRILTAPELAATRRRRFPDWPLQLLCAAEDLEGVPAPVHACVTLVSTALLEQRTPPPVSIPLQLANCAAATLCPARDSCLESGKVEPPDCPARRPIGSGRAFGLPDPLLLASAALRGAPALELWLPRDARDVDRAVLADLVEAAIERLGEAWLADQLSEAEVTLALAELYRVLRPLCDTPPVWSPRGRVLLATLRGSSAVIGPMLKGELLRRAGFAVAIRHGLDAEELARAIEDMTPDAVLLAGSRPFATSQERAELARLHAVPLDPERVRLVLGATLGGEVGRLGAIARVVERALRGTPSSPRPWERAAFGPSLPAPAC